MFVSPIISLKSRQVAAKLLVAASIVLMGSTNVVSASFDVLPTVVVPDPVTYTFSGSDANTCIESYPGTDFALVSQDATESLVGVATATPATSTVLSLSDSASIAWFSAGCWNGSSLDATFSQISLYYYEGVSYYAYSRYVPTSSGSTSSSTAQDVIAVSMVSLVLLFVFVVGIFISVWTWRLFIV